MHASLAGLRFFVRSPFVYKYTTARRRPLRNSTHTHTRTAPHMWRGCVCGNMLRVPCADDCARVALRARFATCSTIVVCCTHVYVYNTSCGCASDTQHYTQYTRFARVCFAWSSTSSAPKHRQRCRHACRARNTHASNTRKRYALCLYYIYHTKYMRCDSARARRVRLSA